MSADVHEKTSEACAAAVFAASQEIWLAAESAAAAEAAQKARCEGASQLGQEGAATKARHDAARGRAPLVWEVFARPGRWRGQWEMAPAFPDGRLRPEEQTEAERTGNLVVAPDWTEEDIARQLESLLHTTTSRV